MDAAELTKAIQQMFEEASQSLVALETKLNQRLDKIEQNLRQEINTKISEQTTALQNEFEEKTKLTVHASLKLAKENLEEAIGETRTKISEEIQKEIKSAINLIRPNPRFCKQSRTHNRKE